MNEKKRVARYQAQHKRHSIWRNIVTCFAAIVVFCTTYALILPAITMEGETTYCGLEEHLHTESCYELICGKEERYIHHHDESCYDPENKDVLVCHKQEMDPHVHSDKCYLTLTCTEEERPGHAHGESCYDEEDNLTCTLEEQSGHTHTEGCYTKSEKTVCGKTAPELHEHSADCYDVICGQEFHAHTDACYVESDVSAAAVRMDEDENAEADEAGQASDANVFLICEDESHDHTEECYSAEVEYRTEIAAPVMRAASEGYIELDSYLSNVSLKTGSNAQWNASTQTYDASIEMHFHFDPIEKWGMPYYHWYEIDAYNFEYEFPDSVSLPDNLLNKNFDLLDENNQPAGIYHFEKKTGSDGKDVYVLKIDVSTTYQIGSNGLTGFITMTGKIGEEELDENGRIDVPFTDSKTLSIDPTKVTYPGDPSDPGHVITKDYDMKATKSAGTYNKDTNTLSYTVTISSQNGTPNHIVMEDIISPNGLPIDDLKSVDVIRTGIQDWYWGRTTLEKDTDYSYSYDKASGKIQLTINEGLPDGYNDSDWTRYEVTYTYSLGDVGKAEYYPNNKMKTQVSGSGQHLVAIDEKTTHINTKIDYKINKTGSYDSANGRIMWTIVVNSGQEDIAGLKIVDEMFASALTDPAMTITPADNGAKREGNTISFSATSDGQNTATYTITYYTQATPGFSDKTVDNRVELKDPSDGVLNSSNPGVNVPGIGSLAKKVDNEHASVQNEVATIPWEVTIGGPFAPGSELTDNLSSNGDTHSLVNHAINTGSISLKYADGSKADVPSGAYSITPGYQGADQNHENVSKLVVRFNQDPLTMSEAVSSVDGSRATKLILSYTTTGPATGETTYNNKVSYYGLDRYASWTYVPEHPTTVDKLNNTDGGDFDSDTFENGNATGVVRWRVNIVTGTSQNAERLTITDTLSDPDKLLLTKISINNEETGYWGELRPDQTTSADSKYNYTLSYDSASGVSTLLVTPIAQGVKIANNMKLHLLYYTQMQGMDALEGGVKITLGNSVVVKDENETDLGHDSITQTWRYDKSTPPTDPTDPTEKVLDKNGSWDEYNQKLDYSVTINPKGEQLNGGNPIHLKDIFYFCAAPGILNREYALDIANVKMYYAERNEQGKLEKGTQYTGFAFTHNIVTPTAEQYASNPWWRTEKTIEGDIPDGIPLILEYTYRLTSITIPENYNDSIRLDVSNTVSLEGVSQQTDKSKEGINWKESETTGRVYTDNHYTFYKVEKGNYGAVIPGAVFKLYKYDTNSQQFVETSITGTTGNKATISSYTSSNAGLFTIYESDGYDVNTLYMLKEESVPAPYIKPTNPPEYKFYFGDPDSTSHLPSGDVMLGAVDLVQSSETEYVENEKRENEYAQIGIYKNWKTYTGEAEPNKENEQITFQLFRKTWRQKPNRIGADDTYGAYFGIPDNDLPQDVIRVGEYTFTTRNGWDSERDLAPHSLLYKNEDGSEYYTYFIIERVPTGYTVKYTNNYLVESGSIGITNTQNHPDYVPLRVQKYWQDELGGNITYSKTGAVSFELYRQAWPSEEAARAADGTNTHGVNYGDTTLPENIKYVGTYEVSSYTNPRWQWTLHDQPKNGKDDQDNVLYYSYFIVEAPSDDYTLVSYVGNNVVNNGTIIATNRIQNPDSTSVTIHKDWVGGTPPASISYELFRKTVSNDPDLPLYPVFIDTYEGDSWGNWKGWAWSSNPPYDRTPGSPLPAGSTIVMKLESSGENAPQITTENIPSDNVSMTQDSNGVWTLRITVVELENTWSTEKIIVKFGNSYSVVDGSLEVIPPSSGDEDSGEKVGPTRTLSAENGWEETITGLAKTDPDGNEYRYYVKEFSVAGYTTTYENNNGVLTGTIKIKNTPTGGPQPDYTSVTVSKQWKDSNGSDLTQNLPARITYKLYQILNGNAAEYTAGHNGELTAGENWTKTISNLPLKDANGNAYSYQVEEIAVYNADGSTNTDFTASYSTQDAVASGTVTITNTKNAPDTTSISVRKEWKNTDGTSPLYDGIPAKITYKLLQNGVEYTADLNPSTTQRELSQNANNWSATIDNLPAMDSSGNAYTYTVEEIAVYNADGSTNTDFTVSYTPETAVQSGTITITNTNTKIETTEINVAKMWQGDGADAARKSIDFKLFYELVESLPDGTYATTNPADVTYYMSDYELQAKSVYCEGEYEITSNNNYSWSKSNLPKKDGDLWRNYFVLEKPEDMNGATVTYSRNGSLYSFRIVNTLDITLGRGPLSVKKEWNGEAKDQVEVKLKRQLITDAKTVTLNIGTWDMGTTKLATKELKIPAGSTLHLTVTSTDGQDTQPLVEMNHSTYQPTSIGTANGATTYLYDLSVSDNQTVDLTLRGYMGHRSVSYSVTYPKVTPKDNDTTVETVTLNKDNGWTRTWEPSELPAEYDGKFAAYYVEETHVTGYKTTYSDTNGAASDGEIIITNTPNAELQLEKNWDPGVPTGVGQATFTLYQHASTEVPGTITSYSTTTPAKMQRRAAGEKAHLYIYGGMNEVSVTSHNLFAKDGYVDLNGNVTVNVPTDQWGVDFSYWTDSEWGNLAYLGGATVQQYDGVASYTIKVDRPILYIMYKVNDPNAVATVNPQFWDNSSGGEEPGGEEPGGEEPGGEEPGGEEPGGGESGGGESGGGNTDNPPITPPTKYDENDVVILDPIILNDSNNWSWNSADLNLPLTGTNTAGQKVYYTYYFVEKNPDPTWTVTYVSDKAVKEETSFVFVVDGKVSVTNQLPPPPPSGSVLPSTGGMGTQPFTLAGLALSMGAVLGLMKKTKRKKGES